MLRLIEIPEGWSWTQIADFAVEHPNAIVDGPFGSNLKVSDYIEDGVPVLQGGNITGNRFLLDGIRFVSERKARELARSLVEVGDLLAVKIGSVGNVAVIDSLGEFEKALIPANLLKATLDPAKACTRFVFHYLTSSFGFKALADAAGQTAQPALGLTKFKSIRIPTPPILEQRRIAEILDTVDDAIAQTEALIAKLRQIKAGLTHDLLARGLDENGQLRDPVAHPERFSDSAVGRIPREWSVQPVGQVFELQLGKMLSKASKLGHSPFPYLANRNVNWDQVDVSDLDWMDFTKAEQEKYALSPGDLVVCEGGEVGRTAMWRGEIETCFFQKAIHRLRPKDSRALPGYMQRYMRLATKSAFFSKFVSQTSIAHLTREKLETLPLPLPPKEEQLAIVNMFDTCDERIRAEEDYLAKLGQIKQGLMSDLLTGRVRVTA